MVKLTCTSPDGIVIEKSYEGRVTIGRNPDNVLCLEDSFASRYHCVIEPHPDGCLLKDLGSTNGTWAKGTRVSDPLVLKPGDEITISRTRIVIRETTPASSSTSRPDLASAPAPSSQPLTQTLFRPASTPSSAAPFPTPTPASASTPAAPPALAAAQALASPPAPGSSHLVSPPPTAAPTTIPVAAPTSATSPALSSAPTAAPVPTLAPAPVSPPGLNRTQVRRVSAVREALLHQTLFSTRDLAPVCDRVPMDTRFLPEKSLTDSDQLRQDYERLRIAHELMLGIGQNLDLGRILEKLLQMCFELLPLAKQGTILLYDEAGVPVPHAHLLRDGKEGEFIEVSTSMIRLIERERAAVLASDATNDPRFKNSVSIIRKGIRSSMGIPFIQQDQLLGILVLDTNLSTFAFTGKDLQLISVIARQAALTIANAQLAKRNAEEAFTRARFERMFSPAVADLIASGEAEITPGGEPRTATILFADIRGFTSLTEQMRPADIVDMLNAYFESMVDVVFEHDGTVDKFIGDELMALFGAPLSRPDDPVRAIRCALGMVKALEPVNEARTLLGFQTFEIGIGINTGDVVAGYIGSSKSLQYTVIGSSVNLTDRLCSRARDGISILVSESTWELTRDHFEFSELDPVPLKGITRPVRAFRVLGEKTVCPGG